jgi:hypothetical protein
VQIIEPETPLNLHHLSIGPSNRLSSRISGCRREPLVVQQRSLKVGSEVIGLPRECNHRVDAVPFLLCQLETPFAEHRGESEFDPRPNQKQVDPLVAHAHAPSSKTYVCSNVTRNPAALR